MKKDIMEFLAKCQNFQQVNNEHQKDAWLLQSMQILIEVGEHSHGYFA